MLVKLSTKRIRFFFTSQNFQDMTIHHVAHWIIVLDGQKHQFMGPTCLSLRPSLYQTIFLLLNPSFFLKKKVGNSHIAHAFSSIYKQPPLFSFLTCYHLYFLDYRGRKKVFDHQRLSLKPAKKGGSVFYNHLQSP